MNGEFGAQFGLEGGSLLDLQKALEAGYVTDATAQVGGGALRIESLEQLLKVLTFQDQHVPFWKIIPKRKALSTVEEYTELSQYGQHEFVFNPEGVLPATQDSTYARRAAFVKYLGVTLEVTHPMTLVRAQTGDVMARQNLNGIMWILRSLEEKLYLGQSNLTVGGTGEGVEFNGLLKNILDRAPADNIIDLANRNVTERDIRNASQAIQASFGTPTHALGNPRAIEDYAKTYIPAERIAIQKEGGGLTAGYMIDEVQTGAGKIRLVGDNFIRSTITFPTVAQGSAPPSPAAASVGGSATGTTGKWANAYPGGVTVQYRATLVNANGESVSVESSAVAITTLTNRVDVTVTNPASFTTAPTYINLYRKDDPGSTGTFGAYSRIARIPISTITGSGTTVFADINDKIPNTTEMYIGQLDDSVMEWRQLLDLVRMDLAVLAPAYRWMVLMYGTMVMYVPARWSVLRNVAVVQ